jgi:hypothetical protein
METADAPCRALEVQGTGGPWASDPRNLRDAGFGLRTIVQRTCHGDGTELGPGWGLVPRVLS